MKHDRLPTVLIVEDEEYLLTLYENWLSDSYTVLTASSGDEAVSAVGESVDVVLLDRKLPQISGDEVLERIRDRGLDCKVAMITSVDIGFDIIDMEFDTYVQKPIDEEELNEVVEQLLTRSMFDNRVQRYLQVATKLSELSANIPQEALAQNEEYQSLVSEQEELRAELEYILQSLDEDYFRSVILNLTSDDLEAEFGRS